jgi:hypothetical protein
LPHLVSALSLKHWPTAYLARSFGVLYGLLWNCQRGTAEGGIALISSDCDPPGQAPWRNQKCCRHGDFRPVCANLSAEISRFCNTAKQLSAECVGDANPLIGGTGDVLAVQQDLDQRHFAQ